jgi:hypothetical protein
VSTEPGRVFREAWIAGVLRHFPGDPKPGYVTPWEQTPDWERASAAAVERLISALLGSSSGAASRLTRQQKGQFVAAAWNAHMYLHFPDPKPAYVAVWEDLPPWQREVDADIFQAVEAAHVE